MKKLFPIVVLALIAMWLWRQGETPSSDAPQPSVVDASPSVREAESPQSASSGDQAEAYEPLESHESSEPRRPSTKPSASRNDEPARDSDTRETYPEFLPPEAHDTLALIESDGPFPHRKDGTVFQNRERRLPNKPRGFYREYTVDTPGSRDRGARRIVAGGDPVETYCYTDDHYRSFRCFDAK